MKLSYQQLTLCLENLFQQTMTKHQASPLTDEEVDDYCSLCDAIIESSGWAVSEYYQAFIDGNWDTAEQVFPG